MAGTEPETTHDAAVALAKAAHAALIWRDPKAERGSRLRLMTDAMAWLARARGGKLVARTLSEFSDLLRRPARDWLPSADNLPLVDDAGPTEYATDLVAESGSAETCEAELVQSRVGDTRQAFARRPNGDTEYVQFRRFLIEHPIASFDQVRDQLQVAGLVPSDLYEEIPPACQVETPSGLVAYPCPRCRWPMFQRDGKLQCPSSICMDAGAQFLMIEPGPQPLGVACSPQPMAIAGQCRLRRGAWRYTLQPGLVELELAKGLDQVNGVDVALWPHRDRYDLEVNAFGRTWAVDVKDWSSGLALADHLARREPDQPISIVVPAHRARQIRLLRERCRSRSFEFYAVPDFVSSIKQYAESRRGQ